MRVYEPGAIAISCFSTALHGFDQPVRLEVSGPRAFTGQVWLYFDAWPFIVGRRGNSVVLSP